MKIARTRQSKIAPPFPLLRRLRLFEINEKFELEFDIKQSISCFSINYIVNLKLVADLYAFLYSHEAVAVCWRVYRGMGELARENMRSDIVYSLGRGEKTDH